jgi:hypothetical protein
MSIANNSSTNPIVVNFSSTRRTNGENSNFYSNPIDIKINKFDSICLLQASVPKSSYNIDIPYNTFTLEENGILSLITIPPASYNNINILPVLTNALNTQSALGWTYNAYYNTPTWHCGDVDNFHFHFTVSNNLGIQPKFIFGLFNMEKPLGFDPNSTNTFIGDELTSQNCVNLSNITRCFIKSNIVVNTYLSILEEILSYGDFPPLSLCYYQQYSVDLNAREFNNSGINSWQFSLVDANDQLINLNGVPWSFSVVFFQRNNLHELQGLELKIQNELRLLDLSAKQEEIIKRVDEKGRLIDMNITDNQLRQETTQALTPQEVSTLDPVSQAINANLPIFPTMAFGSSSIVKDITLDSVNFPSNIKEDRNELIDPVEEEPIIPSENMLVEEVVDSSPNPEPIPK